MPMQQSSPEDIREVRIHLDAESSLSTAYSQNAAGEISQSKTYDGSTLIKQIDTYYASYILINATNVASDWTEDGDGALTTTTFENGSTAIRNTYTFSAGYSNISCATNLGDISSWIGSSCDEGYLSFFVRMSDYTNVTSIELRIGSSTADYRSVTLYSGIDYVANNLYFPLEFNLANGSDVGTPNGAAVDFVALRLNVAAGTSQTFDYYHILACMENSSNIASEIFYDLHRQTETYSSESKTYEYTVAYDSSNNIFSKPKLTGAY